MPAGLDLNKFQDGLQTRVLGRTMFFSRGVDSTNDWAKKLARFGASEGTVTVAETQTCGRGRLNRKWVSPAGGLWFSVILRPKLSFSEAQKLTFVAGLAVAETLHELYGLGTETKWPNDVLVNGRKICGILGEARATGGKVGFVVLGIGVNADFDPEQALPKPISNNATSLEKEVGRKVRREELFKRLLEKLETTYDVYVRNGFSPVLEKWKTYASFLGQEVEAIDQGMKFNGIACDVGQDGALVLRLEDGTLKNIVVGDVSLRSSKRM